MDDIKKILNPQDSEIDSGFGGLSFQSSFSRSNSTYDQSFSQQAQPDSTELRGNSFASSLVEGVRRCTIDRNSTETPSAEALRNERKRELFLRAYTPDTDGDVYLHRYLSQGHWDLAKALIHMTPDNQLFNIQNRYLQTPLHVAAVLNGDDVIRLLISRGARVDLTDCHGNNIFHMISVRGNVQALQAVITLDRIPSKQFLLEVEKGVNARNYMGLSPIYLAVKHRQDAILKILAAFGADVDLPNMCTGESPLHEAVRMSNLPFVDFLVRHCKSNVNAVDFHGVTPLHLAAGFGYEVIAACLMMNGADPTIKDYEDRRAVDVATSDELVKLLK